MNKYKKCQNEKYFSILFYFYSIMKKEIMKIFWNHEPKVTLFHVFWLVLKQFELFEDFTNEKLYSSYILQLDLNFLV